MATRPEPQKPWTIPDWMIETGYGRKTVTEMLIEGELPGYRGKSGRFISPIPAVEIWRRGEWKKPDPEPIAEPEPISIMRTVRKAS
jgi:hypothetical protein